MTRLVLVPSRHQAAWGASAALLLYIVLFWRLGVPSMWDPDEAHYAQTTVEMIESRDWLAPTFNHEPFFDKPVFFHWLQGLSILAIGRSETAVRFASAFAAVMLIAVTGWFGAQVNDRTTGGVAALILACNPAVFALA